MDTCLKSVSRKLPSESRWWSLVVPPEHTHRPQGVPPAWFAFALVHRKVLPAGMGILERPAAIRIALGLDQVDRLGQPLIGSGAGGAQIVETSEHVVVPVRRVGELREGRIDHLTCRKPAKHPSLEEVLVTAEPGGAHLRCAACGSLELQKAIEHVDRRME